MKTTIIFYGVSLCMTVLHVFISPQITNSYELAEKVIAALRQESANDYAELLPTTKELAQLVDENHELYGANQLEAKADLERYYASQTIPQMKKAFGLVIEEGKKKGIEWSKITLESVKLGANEHVIDIIFNYKGACHQVQVEKTLRIKGEWRATQFIKFL